MVIERVVQGWGILCRCDFFDHLWSVIVACGVWLWHMGCGCGIWGVVVTYGVWLCHIGCGCGMWGVVMACGVWL